MMTMSKLYELRRLVAKAIEPNDEDVTQMLGCYQTLDEADLALDAYQSRYPSSYLFIN